MDQFLATRRQPWKQFAAANLTTNTSLDSVAIVDVPLASLPANAKENTQGGNKAFGNTFATFLVFGVGTAAQTIDIRIVGYSLDPTLLRYVPTSLARLTCTLSGVVLASTTNKTCNTISITEGTDGVDVTQQSQALGFATFMVDMKGCDYFDILGNRGSATSFNIWYKGI